MLTRPIARLVMPAMALSLLTCMDMAAYAASSGPAYERGLRMAQRRGYANANCYADLFSNYAVQTRGGRWMLPRAFGNKGTKRVIFVQDVWQRCRIAV